MPPDNKWGFRMPVPEVLYNKGERYNLGVARGTLSEEERYKINEHIVQTLIMLTQLPFPKHLRNVPEIAAGHHEKMDGTGYPRRLKGEHIPLAARIFAVADVFDALCSRRPYKEPMNFETVMEILERESGSHFDPDVMTEFRPMARKIFDHLADCSEEAASKMLEGRVRKHYGL